ncbi:hypothetical protein BDV41DRAFT_378193 [Aspergillus transmontanensis]|uniref:Uncharacterized protein n=1 Tax=Aspergillus transmontanensis TaxID=1034304 RepID=A0A5N6WDG1_9EURO|nr:hypothetical protein BDV41DRAFT_378193 [Aspergillus transmontanensis]
MSFFILPLRRSFSMNPENQKKGVMKITHMLKCLILLGNPQHTDAPIAILDRFMTIQSHHRISRNCVECVDRFLKPVDRLLGQSTGLCFNPCPPTFPFAAPCDCCDYLGYFVTFSLHLSCSTTAIFSWHNTEPCIIRSFGPEHVSARIHLY